MNIGISADENTKVERLAQRWSCSREEALRRVVQNGLCSYDIKEPWWRNFHVLGAPLRGPDKSKFVDALRNRFGGASASSEEAFKYIDVVTDRIISKGVGLLQFNALLGVLLVWAFEHYAQNRIEHQILFWSLGASIVSSVFMIVLMYTVWRKTGYDDANFDLSWSANLCMFRSVCMSIGLILSFLAIVGAAATYIHHELDPPIGLGSLTEPPLRGIETRLDSVGASLSLIQDNLETIATRLNKVEAKLPLMPTNLETVKEQLLDIRRAQPVNLSYLRDADCRRVQQVLQQLAVYQGGADGKCGPATNAAASTWQMQERRAIAPAQTAEEIVKTLLDAPGGGKAQP
jgi:hypothetical protein